MAIGAGTVSSIGSAVQSFGQAAKDIYQSEAQASSLRLKAKGDRVEADNYDLAGDLAHQNEVFTEQSFAVKQVQADRSIQMGIGGLEAGVAGAGFSNSGSALDLLRSSANQGAVQKQLLGQQGLIQEAALNEQQKAYGNMAGYARYAADEEENQANIAIENGKKSARFDKLTGYIHIAAAVASVFTGGDPGAGGGGGGGGTAEDHDPALDS